MWCVFSRGILFEEFFYKEKATQFHLLHGFCLLNRFGVNVPYRKHDFAWFFYALAPNFFILKP